MKYLGKWCFLSVLVSLMMGCSKSSCVLKYQYITYGENDQQVRPWEKNRTPLTAERIFSAEGVLMEDKRCYVAERCHIRKFSASGKLLTETQIDHDTLEQVIEENRYDQRDSLVYHAKSEFEQEPYHIKTVTFNERGQRRHLEIVEKEPFQKDVLVRTIEVQYDAQGRPFEHITTLHEKSPVQVTKVFSTYDENSGQLMERVKLDKTKRDSLFVEKRRSGGTVYYDLVSAEDADTLEVYRYDKHGNLLYQTNWQWYTHGYFPAIESYKYDQERLLWHQSSKPDTLGNQVTTFKESYRYEGDRLMEGGKYSLSESGEMEPYFQFKLWRDTVGRITRRIEVGDGDDGVKSILRRAFDVGPSEDEWLVFDMDYFEGGYRIKNSIEDEKGKRLVSTLEVNADEMKLTSFEDEGALKGVSFFKPLENSERDPLDFLKKHENVYALTDESSEMLDERLRLKTVGFRDGRLSSEKEFIKEGRQTIQRMFKDGHLIQLTLTEQLYDSVYWHQRWQFFAPEEAPESAQKFSDTSDLKVLNYTEYYEVFTEGGRRGREQIDVQKQFYDAQKKSHVTEVLTEWNDEHQPLKLYHRFKDEINTYDAAGRLISYELKDRKTRDIATAKYYRYDGCGNLSKATVIERGDKSVTKVKTKYW